MPEAVYRMLRLLGRLVEPEPVDTNLGLLHSPPLTPPAIGSRRGWTRPPIRETRRNRVPPGSACSLRQRRRHAAVLS
jgi:hypothetical protein